MWTWRNYVRARTICAILRCLYYKKIKEEVYSNKQETTKNGKCNAQHIASETDMEAEVRYCGNCFHSHFAWASNINAQIHEYDLPVKHKESKRYTR